MTAPPSPPRLGGGISPMGWLRQIAGFDDKKQAHARAREARAMADWLDELALWIKEHGDGN